MSHVIDVNRAIRNLRAEKGVEAGARPAVYLRASSQAEALRETSPATAFTSRVEPQITGAGAELPAGEYAFARVGDTEVALALPEVDLTAERERLERELAEADGQITRLEKQLSNERFLERAPEAVVQGERDRLAQTQTRAEGLRERIAAAGELAEEDGERGFGVAQVGQDEVGAALAEGLFAIVAGRDGKDARADGVPCGDIVGRVADDDGAGVGGGHAAHLRQFLEGGRKDLRAVGGDIAEAASAEAVPKAVVAQLQLRAPHHVPGG